MPTVIDDATLLAVLAGEASAELLAMAAAGEVVTTGSWYYRLHRAVHDDRSSGALSLAAGQLSAAARSEVMGLLAGLPAEIVVPGPRLLVPIMGSLGLRLRVNYLTSEALAAAIVTGASIRVSIEAAPLRTACRELGINVDVRSPLE